jgi:hypothetical protein
MSTVTCRTAGCENNGIQIELDLTFRDDQGVVHQVDTVICGACGQPITDIKR